MTTPTETPPTDPIRDSFEAMIALLSLLIGGRAPRPWPEVAIAAAKAVVVLAGAPGEGERLAAVAAIMSFRDLIQRAAEEHARRTQIEGCDVCGRTPTTPSIESTGEERHTCAEHTDEPPLTEEELRAAEERCERATPEPWEATGDDVDVLGEDGEPLRLDIISPDGELLGSFDQEDNALFATASRAFEPRALREIRRLRRVEALVGGLEQANREAHQGLAKRKAEIERWKAATGAASPEELNAALEAYRARKDH